MEIIKTYARKSYEPYITSFCKEFQQLFHILCFSYHHKVFDQNQANNANNTVIFFSLKGKQAKKQAFIYNNVNTWLFSRILLLFQFLQALAAVSKQEGRGQST